MQAVTQQKKYNQRALKDRLTDFFVSLGGIAVIVSILLIFLYLIYVVAPMFGAATIREQATYPAPGGGETLLLGQEERGTVAMRLVDDGRIVFFNTRTGETVLDQTLDLPAPVSSVAANLNRVALGLQNGQAVVLQYDFELSYPDNVRTVTPHLRYPLGEQPLVLDEDAQALEQVVIQLNEDVIGLAAVTDDRRLVFARYVREESFLDGEITTSLESLSAIAFEGQIIDIALTPSLDHLYAARQQAILTDYALNEDGFAEIVEQYHLTDDITSIDLLLGGSSLLVALDSGEVQQWMSVRTENDRQLKQIRAFSAEQHPVTALATEQQRKGFAVADTQGDITLYYATSNRTLAQINTARSRIEHMAWSARATDLLAIDAEQRMHVYNVENEYPEVSWQVLWGKVWYEGYDEPDYIWQSSSSTNDFEPKYSLVPLSFGTIKAALYAMLFAVPIALFGAMYTAQFMAPRMRQTVKPAIEIMEALPTVILGFLAGLWLAPYVETHLAGIFTLLLILPLGFLLFAWLWRYAPNQKLSQGWEAAMLMPVVLLLIWLSMSLSAPLEHWLFGGDMRSWMSERWGLGYDQRNALVVGLIMGFAIIPTIFSIAEDALFSVPQHLIRGSLALGASRWQTMMRVVLPAASPAVFSALMMGFGRAVGETMIVLMATGNTPLIDMSIFQGMRTLAANIAVEVPEAEVASTHYRVLFLAALLLFLFTFVFNTLAEVIRHRLRQRYSGL